MNLRSELLEIFAPEVGHALSISSWDRLEEWMKRKLADNQAAMVERCANRVDAYRGVAQKQTAWTWGEVNNLLVDLREQVRALSPDPHARERWELEARLDEHAKVTGHHKEWVGSDEESLGEYICVHCERRTELERQLAALPAVTL